MAGEPNPLAIEVKELKEKVISMLPNAERDMNEIKDKAQRFLDEATPEHRQVHDIVIGGSANILYPVWFQWPGNSAGYSRLSVARDYSWNGGVGERPLDPDRPHQAGLILELEGNVGGWGGHAHFQEIKRFSQQYNPTVSHANVRMFCRNRSLEGGSNYFGSDKEAFQHPFFSGFFLRGGGLSYRITKNWAGDVHYHDGEGEDRLLSSHWNGASDPNRSSLGVELIAHPIPMDLIQLPNEDVNAFVDFSA